MKYVFFQRARQGVGISCDQIMDQASVCLVCQDIFSGVGFAASVEVTIGEIELSSTGLGKKPGEVVDGFIHTLDVHIFRLLSWNFEFRRPKRAKLGHDL